MNNDANNQKKTFNIPNSVRRKAYEKYVKYGEYTLYNHSGCGVIAWVVLWFWTLGLGLMTPTFNSIHDREQNMNVASRTKQRARDLFYPISNGWYVPLPQMTSGANYIKYVHDDAAVGKFKPRAVWVLNIACLLVAAYWGIGFARAKSKQRRANKNQEKMVDVMLELPFIGARDAKKIEKLMTVAPEIVSHMSNERRVYFDTLLNPNQSTDMRQDIINNDGVRNMAIEIMVGHLQSHPEDMERAIRICADNAIPRNMLTAKLNQNQR